ncbi:MAG TPA: Gfo/Idh/MocA family oxidoreductase [Actinomycetes bacterium]|nr:Gfo/Idh/MocA family oxidoreductase [Actinomycetes bacterium]
MTRIGIAGRFGRQGSRWAETLPEGMCGAVLVRELDDKTLEELRASGIPNGGVVRLAFLKGCDAVIVATPVETHYGIAGAALRAGKPVLCEKPLVLSLQTARHLYQVAAGSKARLWTCYPHLWHPAVEAMAKRAEVDAEITFCGPTEAEPLLDWAPHALSMALYLLGTDALLKTKILTSDHKRASCEIESDRGRAFVTFGLSPVKRVHVQLKNQPRLYYNGENCHPTTMQRMLAAWLRSEDDPRGDPALTLGVHEILEEVLR